MRKVVYGSIFAFAFTVPISSYVSAKFLALTFCLSIFVKISNRSSFSQAIKGSWDILVYFIILALGLINSEDVETGLKVIETNLSLVALLFIFSRLENISNQLVHKFIVTFLLGLLLANLVCLGNAVVNYIQSGDYHVFFYYQLTDVIKFHPTYLAYYLIFSITYLIYLMYYGIEKRNKVAWIIVLTFFFLMLLLTGGRTAYVSLLMIFSFFILKYLLEERTKEKKLIFIIVVTFMIALFGFNSINSLDPEFSKQNDYWERSLLWESAIVANPNPVVGVGTGDYKTVLNEYYQSHSMPEFARESYNSHNQFIQIYFSNGLIGLMVLVVLIGRPLYLSVRSQNAFGILIMFPFVIYGITEVFLGRYQGVVFFALLHQIAIYQHYSARSSFTLKEG